MFRDLFKQQEKKGNHKVCKKKSDGCLATAQTRFTRLVYCLNFQMEKERAHHTPGEKQAKCHCLVKLSAI